MENSENQHFEREWRKALEGAEVTPSDDVWKAIDAHSMYVENISMRKRVIFYQRLAAASVAILFLFSGYFFLKPAGKTDGSELTTNNPKQTTTNGTEQANNTNQAIKQLAETQEGQPSSAALDTQGKKNNDPSSQIAERSKSFTNQGYQNPAGVTANTLLMADLPTNSNLEDSGDYSNDLPKEKKIKDPKLIPLNHSISTVNLLPVESMLEKIFKPNDYIIAYRLADARPAVHLAKQNPISKEKNWASVGFAAGNFQPSVSNGDLVQASRISSINPLGLQGDTPTPGLTSGESSKQGISMSYSLAAGRRIFKRWILQGGVSYLNQTASSTGSVLAVSPANQVQNDALKNLYAAEAITSVTYATPSEIKSTTQFISIPLQAGYMLIDQKLGFQVNAGVAPDIFLKNEVYENSTQNEIVSSSKSKGSFKSMSLAGIGGLELSYRFSKHYRISLVPGFRYSLTPVYKETSLSSSKPFVGDIGLRFRYVFSN